MRVILLENIRFSDSDLILKFKQYWTGQTVNVP